MGQAPAWSALGVELVIRDQVQAAARGRDPTGRRVGHQVGIGVVDALADCSGWDIVAGIRDETALVHLPGAVAVGVEIIRTRGCNAGTILGRGNHRQGRRQLLHLAGIWIPGIAVGGDDLRQRAGGGAGRTRGGRPRKRRGSRIDGVVDFLAQEVNRGISATAEDEEDDDEDEDELEEDDVQAV